MIKVIDNFLESEEIQKLYEVLWNADWYLQGTDYALNQRNDRGWSLTKYMDLKNEENQIYQEILEKVCQIDELKDLTCSRVLRNAYKFGDVIGLHKDLGYDITVLIFGNHEWKLNWGSETIFTDTESDDAEIIKSVIPKPGRLVMFDSLIPHTGRVPSPAFPHYRYSLVFNFKKNL
jgi:hypothetical protein